ncbi:hypothetical protein TCAL_17033 [Tigriopus californicus]|uniref:Uncharacterized protein n=1 Tax=Tigriopus californicus TaxID=6832 RepID=A0A553PHQ5_TIGCA|nr:hypothetical protein TCAL_17033 [Tigriopus californicus]
MPSSCQELWTMAQNSLFLLDMSLTCSVSDLGGLSNTSIVLGGNFGIAWILPSMKIRRTLERFDLRYATEASRRIILHFFI